jgi:hypothetical protein
MTKKKKKLGVGVEPRLARANVHARPGLFPGPVAF